MKFELVKETNKQRFYKSDIEITKFPRDIFNWEEEINNTKKRLKEGCELLDDKCYYICVSDAKTHIERLVFVAGRFKDAEGNINYGIYSNMHIDGSLTFMIHGGDYESIKDDQVYLRHLSILNK